MTNEEMDGIAKWAEGHPHELMAMHAALCMKATTVTKDYVRVFLECLGNQDGTRFLGCIDDILREDWHSEDPPTPPPCGG